MLLNAFDYSMWMSMNQAGLAEGAYESTAHNVIVTMAGPLVTYVQAGVAFFLARANPGPSISPCQSAPRANYVALAIV